MLKYKIIVQAFIFTGVVFLCSPPSMADVKLEEPSISNPQLETGAEVIPPQNSSDFKIKIGGGLGYERLGESSGLGINANLKADFNNFRASAEVIDLFFTFSAKNNGYYTDTFSNGQSRCRNGSNGQFASSSNCSPNVNVDVKFLRDADLSYGFPVNSNGARVFLGAGTSITDNRGIYGVIGYEDFLKVKIGSDRLDIRLGW